MVYTTLSQACNTLVIWSLQGCFYQGIETVNRLGQPCYMLAQPYSYNVTYAQYEILVVGT